MTPKIIVWGELDERDERLIEDLRTIYRDMDFVERMFWVLRLAPKFEGHFGRTVMVLTDTAYYGVSYRQKAVT